MNSSLIQLLVLAGIAVFLVLKLRSVLGTRDGFEKPPLPAEERGPARVVRPEVIENGPDRDITDHVPEDSEIARTLTRMKKADPAFAVTPFLSGAKLAHEMILTAFDKGDLDSIRPYLGDEVREGFAAAIAARSEQGLAVQSSFIGLREMTLDDASLDETTNTAEITVRFLAELISTVRNAAGDIVEGDPKAVRRQRDIWTFGRKMPSDDPNWKLIATGG